MPIDAAAKAQRAVTRSRLARYGAWAAGLVIVALAAMVVTPLVLPGKDGVETPIAAPELPEQVVASKGEISGLGKGGQPYSISAAKSIQDAEAKNVVHLEAVAGNFAQAGGNGYDVESANGTYNNETKNLELKGNVRITNSKGMTARMAQATINAESRALVSKTPVNVTLPNGTVAADTLEADSGGEKLVFRGRVKAVLEGAQQ